MASKYYISTGITKTDISLIVSGGSNATTNAKGYHGFPGNSSNTTNALMQLNKNLNYITINNNDISTNRRVNTRTYTSPSPVTIPTWCNSIRFMMVGGGGSAGNAGSNYQNTTITNPPGTLRSTTVTKLWGGGGGGGGGSGISLTQNNGIPINTFRNNCNVRVGGVSTPTTLIIGNQNYNCPSGNDGTSGNAAGSGYVGNGGSGGNGGNSGGSGGSGTFGTSTKIKESGITTFTSGQLGQQGNQGTNANGVSFIRDGSIYGGGNSSGAVRIYFLH